MLTKNKDVRTRLVFTKKKKKKETRLVHNTFFKKKRSTQYFFFMQKERLVFYYKEGLKAILLHNLSPLNLFNESVKEVLPYTPTSIHPPLHFT